MFSSDPEVVSIVASIAPFAAVGELMDGFGASQGVLRGCGRQALILVIALLVSDLGGL